MVATRLKTTEDLLALPDDGWRHELLEGEIIRMPLAGWLHGMTAAQIICDLGLFVEREQLGTAFSRSGFPIERDPDTTLGPDISFVRTGRLPPERDWQPYAEVVPDLVIEIDAPPLEDPDIIARKLRVYLRAGVSLVWLVRPLQKEIEIHRPGRGAIILGEGDTLDGYDVVPGFSLPVAEVFA